MVNKLKINALINSLIKIYGMLKARTFNMTYYSLNFTTQKQYHINPIAKINSPSRVNNTLLAAFIVF